MSGSARIAALRHALIATGVIFIGGIWTLAQVWPSGWSWGVGHSHFWPMILGVYATLGVFLIRASRDPLANRSLIWFTVWSSVVHALVMAASAVGDPAERWPWWVTCRRCWSWPARSRFSLFARSGPRRPTSAFAA